MMQNKLNMFKKFKNMSLTLITIRVNVKSIHIISLAQIDLYTLTISFTLKDIVVILN